VQLSPFSILTPHPRLNVQLQQYVCLHLQTVKGLIVETDSTAECSNSKNQQVALLCSRLKLS